MTDYTKLVEALRYCGNFTEREGCDESCEYFNDMDCPKRIMSDAAAAIEELIESVHIRDKNLDELNHYIWKLEAEVKRLKECNDELREAQTYIDHYGDRWMTSAKDVPTAAYEHGDADGMAEVKAQLQKRGKWITIRLNNGGSYTGCSCCEAPIPTDTMLDYIPESESKYCYSCGAKMEVQDGK